MVARHSKKYQNTVKFVRAQNEIQYLIGGKNFLKCFFAGADGVYYDAIGNEIFTAIRFGGTDERPGYLLDFGDEQTIGILVDHGFNEYLGKIED